MKFSTLIATFILFAAPLTFAREGGRGAMGRHHGACSAFMEQCHTDAKVTAASKGERHKAMGDCVATKAKEAGESGEACLKAHEEHMKKMMEGHPAEPKQ